MTSNSNAVERVTARPAAPAAAHVGQATAIEQSRAVAEVQAAVVVAQQCPRDIDKAIAQMRRSCDQRGLAERAFYAYRRGTETINGASVHLARDLARCWGNIQYGFAELHRDVVNGVSEMQAWAWDVETNTRSSQIFLVPHKRDTKTGVKSLVDMRDVYENNANLGSRRLREAIFSVLPPWFTEEAKQRCHQTLTPADANELTSQIDVLVKAFSRRGITQQQLDAKAGLPREKWTGEEYAQLGVLYGSLKRGEITRDEAFPAPGVTADEITGAAQAADAAGLPPATEDDTWPHTAAPGGES